ncbi:MAG: DJ-1/PfpI family protein, partial [Planctomycetes bacterium]|nr:DJ-1/PfpI family protein [Planctomycetota bacterium]
MASVLIIINHGCEEIEYINVADILVRAQHDVCIATGSDMQVTGSRGLPLCAQVSLDDVLAVDYDLIYLPGGLDQAEFCCADPRVQQLIQQRISKQQLLAIICASPTALIPQGFAKGRSLTCYPGMRDKLESAGANWLDERVVQDGTLITSQGPGTAMELGIYLVRILGDTAQE